MATMRPLSSACAGWQDPTELCGVVSRGSNLTFTDDDAGSVSSTEPGSDGTTPPEHWLDEADGLTRPTPCRSLIVFDWDDTLLPTTWLHQQGLMREGARASEEQDVQLRALADLVAVTLDVAKRRSGVSIVTNAERGWVELSCRRFMPTLQAHLEGVRIVSARARHEKHGLFAPTTWKCLAFEEVVGEFYGAPDGTCVAPRRSVVSIGDSEYEMEALKWVANGEECYAKCLKFVQRPCLNQLMEQHELVAGVVDDVVDHDGNLDYEIGLEGD